MEQFGSFVFTPSVQAEQEKRGTRDACAKMAARPAPKELGEDEIAYLTSRTSIYMATVSQTGWPYIQHRGGPAGFIKVLNPKTISFADYRGNRQYVTTGNLKGDDRVSIFALDYARKARLKLLGHAALVEAEAEPDLAAMLSTAGEGRVERLTTIRLVAFDWNCPQFITQRFDTSEFAALVGPEIERLEARNAELEADLTEAYNQLNQKET
jgi:predicted pyridoxine 5'-phosphate oxidase superfamily flavin-nucleotide-binding protein